MNIIGHRKIYLTVSALLIVAGIFLVINFGFKEGIDFKGGTLWQIKLGNETALVQVEELFKNEIPEAGEVKINTDITNQAFLIRFQPISEPDHQKFLSIIKTKYPSAEELSFQSIGPSIGVKLKKNAVTAVLLAILIVSLYIAFAFRKVSKPISSWKYGVVTMVTLLHDIVIPAGLIALLGSISNAEIDSNFVVALLVIMGFSVHDTIVVFDRIRENLLHNRGKMDFSETINQSVNQTIARSINTSLTLIIVLLVMYFVGPVHLKYFILTLLVGVTTGVYSSIFVASPLLLVWHRLSERKQELK